MENKPTLRALIEEVLKDTRNDWKRDSEDKARYINSFTDAEEKITYLKGKIDANAVIINRLEKILRETEGEHDGK